MIRCAAGFRISTRRRDHNVRTAPAMRPPESGASPVPAVAPPGRCGPGPPAAVHSSDHHASVLARWRARGVLAHHRGTSEAKFSPASEASQTSTIPRRCGRGCSGLTMNERQRCEEEGRTSARWPHRQSERSEQTNLKRSRDPRSSHRCLRSRPTGGRGRRGPRAVSRRWRRGSSRRGVR